MAGPGNGTGSGQCPAVRRLNRPILTARGAPPKGKGIAHSLPRGGTVHRAHSVRPARPIPYALGAAEAQETIAGLTGCLAAGVILSSSLLTAWGNHSLRSGADGDSIRQAPQTVRIPPGRKEKAWTDRLESSIPPTVRNRCRESRWGEDTVPTPIPLFLTQNPVLILFQDS